MELVGSTNISYTDAAGNQLDSIFTFTGTLNPQTAKVQWQGTEIYQGGTGKYAQATDTSTVIRQTDFSTNKGHLLAGLAGLTTTGNAFASDGILRVMDLPVLVGETLNAGSEVAQRAQLLVSLIGSSGHLLE